MMGSQLASERSIPGDSSRRESQNSLMLITSSGGGPLSVAAAPACALVTVAADVPR